MPNHAISIEEADLWDVLDWDTVVTLSLDATGGPKANPIAAVARKLIELGAKPGKEDLQFFHKVFTAYVTAGAAASRREHAGSLALLLGARPDRLIDFAAYKWGLFKRPGRPKP